MSTEKVCLTDVCVKKRKSRLQQKQTSAAIEFRIKAQTR